MATKHSILTIETTQLFEIVNITAHAQEAVHASGIASGVIVISTPHTTAGIKLNHHEPLLIQDIVRTMNKLAPQDTSYNHDLFEQRQHATPGERSNGHAHIKTFLLGASESLPILDGRIVLGDRQNILFVECDGARKRTVHITMLGE